MSRTHERIRHTAARRKATASAQLPSGIELTIRFNYGALSTELNGDEVTLRKASVMRTSCEQVMVNGGGISFSEFCENYKGYPNIEFDGFVATFSISELVDQCGFYLKTEDCGKALDLVEQAVRDEKFEVGPYESVPVSPESSGDVIVLDTFVSYSNGRVEFGGNEHNGARCTVRITSSELVDLISEAKSFCENPSAFVGSEATASATSFKYRGKLITASSKAEAIRKIVARCKRIRKPLTATASSSDAVGKVADSILDSANLTDAPEEMRNRIERTLMSYFTERDGNLEYDVDAGYGSKMDKYQLNRINGMDDYHAKIDDMFDEGIPFSVSSEIMEILEEFYEDLDIDAYAINDILYGEAYVNYPSCLGSTVSAILVTSQYETHGGVDFYKMMGCTRDELREALLEFAHDAPSYKLPDIVDTLRFSVPWDEYKSVESAVDSLLGTIDRNEYFLAFSGEYTVEDLLRCRDEEQVTVSSGEILFSLSSSFEGYETIGELGSSVTFKGYSSEAKGSAFF